MSTRAEPAPSSVAAWAARWLDRLNAVRTGRRQRQLLAVAAVVFVGGSVVAYLRLPTVEEDIRWWLLALVPLVGVPATVATNTLEYQATARLLHLRVGLFEAVRISVLSTAANLLPIPGAVLVRAQALRRLGSNYRRAFSATALVGLAWLGVTAVLAGSLHAFGADAPIGIGFTAAGIAMLIAFTTLAHRSTRDARRTRISVAEIIAVEAGSVVAGALRFYLVILGLGFDVSFPQAVALTVAGVLASTTGVFPGGLGIRELLAAGIGPLVGLPAAVGLLAAAVDRIAGLAVLAILSGVLVLMGADQPPEVEADDELAEP